MEEPLSKPKPICMPSGNLLELSGTPLTYLENGGRGNKGVGPSSIYCISQSRGWESNEIMYVRQCCLTLPHKAGHTGNNSRLVSADEAAPASGLAVEMGTREPFTGWAQAGDWCLPHSYSLMQPEEYPESTGRTGTQSFRVNFAPPECLYGWYASC